MKNSIDEQLPPLTEELRTQEKVFLAPPFTEELVKAIKLISPQFNLTESESSRAYWEADQNGACWGEYEALQSVLERIDTSAGKILEIGPGLGRSIIFFSKKLQWQNKEFHAYEGEGSQTRYTLQGPRFDDSFCGNFDMLRYCLDFNEINNVKIIDSVTHSLTSLPGPYDLIYSFYSVGFHWSLEHFLSEISILMNDRSYAVFTVPSDFKVFSGLDDFSYQILDWDTVWPKNGKLKMLVIQKK